MRTLDGAGVVAAVVMLGSVIPAASQEHSGRVAIDRSLLCVTEGTVGAEGGHGLSVDVPKMRAYIPGASGDAMEAHFTYLGRTEVSRLGSGEVRSQFGLKLRAQNACNLIYAMWRMEPEAKLVVSIKKNPGATMSSECGNRGYENIKPRRTMPLPMLRPGDTHALNADLRGTALRVSVDGSPVWEGDVGPEANDLTGPPGIRSDNVRLRLELEAGVQAGAGHACQSGPGVSD